MSDPFTSTESYLFLGKDQIDEFLWLVILGGFVMFAMVCIHSKWYLNWLNKYTNYVTGIEHM